MTSYVAPSVPAVGGAITATQGDILANNWLTIGGAWTPYTPVLTATTTNPTLGSGGTITGRYMQIGKTVMGWATITFGSSGTNAGSGLYRVTVPATGLAGQNFIGDGRLMCAGVATRLQVLAGVSAGVVGLRYYTTAVGGTNQDVTNTTPGAWTINDSINMSFLYEAV